MLCHHLKICLSKNDPIKCSKCFKKFTSIKVLKYHLICNECITQSSGGESINEVPLNSKFELSSSAFKKFLQIFTLISDDKINDSTEFFLTNRDNIKELVIFLLNQLSSLKIQFCLKVKFIRDVGGHITEQYAYFTSVSRPLSNIKFFSQLFFKSISDIDTNIQEYMDKGSGWVVDSIEKLEVRVGKYNPLYGSCNVKLPQKLLKKQAVINIQNKDEKCFLYAVIVSVFMDELKTKIFTLSFCQKYVNRFN